MELGVKIKQLRETAGLKIKELHDLTGISASYITELEKCRKTPSIEIVQKLADGLGVSIIQLLGQDENILHNIKLIMGNMTVKEFVQSIVSSTGCDIINEDDIKSYLSGSIMPNIASLQVIADYAKVGLDVMYKPNTAEQLKLMQEMNNSSGKADEYLKIFNKINNNDLDLKELETIIDIMIKQKQK